MKINDRQVMVKSKKTKQAGKKSSKYNTFKEKKDDIIESVDTYDERISDIFKRYKKLKNDQHSVK